MNSSPVTMRDTMKRPTLYRGGEEKQEPEKPAENQTPKPHPVVKETIQAAHVFSPEEVAAQNLELRAKLDEIELLQDQKKTAAQDFKLRIDNAENTVKQLRNKLKAGSEPRTVEAIVLFHAPAGKKRYYHPHTGQFIREEDMAPADWQLPMFKPAPDGKSEVPATQADESTPKPAVPPAVGEPGETRLGDALDAAVTKTEAPKFVLDLTQEDWQHGHLTRAFKKAAKVAGWSTAQVSALADRLKECDTVEKMIDTLRPHSISPAAPESEVQQPEATHDQDNGPENVPDPVVGEASNITEFPA